MTISHNVPSKILLLKLIPLALDTSRFSLTFSSAALFELTVALLATKFGTTRIEASSGVGGGDGGVNECDKVSETFWRRISVSVGGAVPEMVNCFVRISMRKWSLYE